MHNPTERTIAWIQRQGAVLCQDPVEKKRMTEYITPAAVLFSDLVNRVATVYPYRMSEQIGEAAGSDAICWKNVTNYAGTLYAIGISTEALDKGPEYAAFLFIHELAHIKESEHNYIFHEILSAMIGQYNHAYSANLTNDMAGLPIRYDSRPYVLPDNIPVETGCKGTAFRTEAKG